MAQDPVAIKRHGVRVIAFLVLVLIGLIASWAQGHHTILTLLAVLVGFGGATWHSLRGLHLMYTIPPDRRARGRIEDSSP